jgi:hypothetical protein
MDKCGVSIERSSRPNIGLLHHRRRTRKRKRRRRLLWNVDALIPDYTASHRETDFFSVTAMINSNHTAMKHTVH